MPEIDEMTDGYLKRVDDWCVARISAKFSEDVTLKLMSSFLRDLSNDKGLVKIIGSAAEAMTEFTDLYDARSFGNAMRDGEALFSDMYKSSVETDKVLQQKVDGLVCVLRTKGTPGDVQDSDIDAAFVRVFGGHKGFYDALVNSFEAEFNTCDLEADMRSVFENTNGMTSEEVRQYGKKLLDMVFYKPFKYIFETVFGDLSKKK